MTSPGLVGRSGPRLVSFISFAALIAVSLAFTPRATAQNSSTMLSTGVAVDVCNSCDLQTQEALASEDDRHDSQDSAFDSSERSENVSHDEADQSIERSNMQGELKQEALANEQERHQNALAAIERNRAIEASRHQQYLAEIMAKAGKLLSDLVQNVTPNGSPAGAAPSSGGAPGSSGPPPVAGGAPITPNQPGAGNAPSGGGNPVAGGGSPSLGANPPGTGSPPITGNPIAGGGSPGTAGSGAQPNPPPNNTEYQGPQPVNPSQPSGSPQDSSSSPGNQNPGILKGLNDWINGVAQKMAPPPSTGTGQPYTGPLAINGHSPLYYLNEAANSLADKLPGGSQSLQNANQAVGNFANGQASQWTTPMSPSQAAAQVGGAFVGAGIGKGLGVAGGTLKNAYGQAIQNGAGRLGGLQAAGNSIGAASSAGLAAGKQELATLSGVGGGLAGRNLGGNPPGGGESSTSGGSNQSGNSLSGGASTNGGAEPPAVGGGGPTEPGVGSEPSSLEPSSNEPSSSTSTTQTAQAGGPSRTQPQAGGGAPAKPPESVEPPAGSGTPSNPLTGQAVSNSWQNLAGKTVVVGGKPVQLGNMVGSPGGFGAVYQIEGDPGQVLKVVRPGAAGADSITRQLEGAKLAGEAKIATPEVSSSSAGADGDPPHIIMDNVNGGKWSNVQTPSRAQLTPQQRTAMEQLYKQLGDNGLIWADGKLNNVFFYGSPQAPSVGILDPDMIFPANQLEWQPPVVNANLMKNASEAMKQALFNQIRNDQPIDAWAVMRDRFQQQFAGR